jgi:hypothetical protein
VDYAVTDGTATEHGDYTTTRGTLHFAQGETSKSFDVLLTNDAYVENNETLNLSLSNPQGTLSSCIVAQGATAVLTIVDDDTTAPIVNPVDDAGFFVRQHYMDFLSRGPDQGGLDYWTERIKGNAANNPAPCASDDAACVRQRRIGVSAAFFIEAEFQETGNFVYRFYKASLGRRPAYNEFMPDRSQVVGGASLETSKLQFADNWVQRSEFLQKYDASLSGTAFIDALLQNVQQNSQVDLSSQRAALIADYNANASRARIVRLVADNPAFAQAEYNKAFVLMQYFGYLRRDPEEGGFLFWLNVLDTKVPNNYRAMVCAFLTSREYQERFSSIVTSTNRDCGP